MNFEEWRFHSWSVDLKPGGRARIRGAPVDSDERTLHTVADSRLEFQCRSPAAPGIRSTGAPLNSGLRRRLVRFYNARCRRVQVAGPSGGRSNDRESRTECIDWRNFWSSATGSPIVVTAAAEPSPSRFRWSGFLPKPVEPARVGHIGTVDDV